VLELALYLALK